MGKMIEQIALDRGHEIVSIIDIDNQQDFDAPAFASADVAIEFTAPQAAFGNYLKAWEKGVKVEDKIVYHRDGRYRRINEAGQSVPVQMPYYPLMSIHSHWSGFDISFENDDLGYRASALIRKYIVYNLRTKKSIKLETSKKSITDLSEEDLKLFVGTIYEQDIPYVDKRSQYLAYYLNGFSLEGGRSEVRWIDLKEPVGSELEKPQKGRQNAYDHDWAYSAVSPEKYIPQIISSDAFGSVKG